MIELDVIDSIFDKIDGISVSEVRFPIASNHSLISWEEVEQSIVDHLILGISNKYDINSIWSIYNR